MATTAKKTRKTTAKKATTAKKTTAKKSTTTKKTTAKKTTTAKKPTTKKTVSKTKVDSSSIEKSVELSLNDFRLKALSKTWRKDELIRAAKEDFQGVKVEEYNNKQIAFEIKGKRLPEKGYFTVN